MAVMIEPIQSQEPRASWFAMRVQSTKLLCHAPLHFHATSRELHWLAVEQLLQELDAGVGGRSAAPELMFVFSLIHSGMYWVLFLVLLQSNHLIFTFFFLNTLPFFPLPFYDRKLLCYSQHLLKYFNLAIPDILVVFYFLSFPFCLSIFLI